MSYKRLIAVPVLVTLLSRQVLAHCPLCTIGAAAAAGGAVWLGVSKAVVGLFLGAFAASLGWWVSRLIKKKYIPFQRTLLIAFSFITTIIPLTPLFKSIYPLYISIGGDYGSLLNRTYLINPFVVTSILGALLVSMTPWMSSRITIWREGKTIPFQGVTLTLLLLVVLGVVIQFAG